MAVDVEPEEEVKTCKIEGCVQPVENTRGRYANLCAGHREEVVNGRDAHDYERKPDRESGMTAVGPMVTNAALEDIVAMAPYQVNFTIQGIADILFHRWTDEAVAEKAAAAKGSKGKKTDNIESYLWRDRDKNICLPGEYVRMSMVDAARFRQDPRSPRKSARDLYKAALVPLTTLAPIIPDGKKGPTKDWDFLDARRVMVQRNAITRKRPAFERGWKASFEFEVTLPEYVEPQQFLETLALAGRVQGTADFRPTYGRYQVIHFEHTKMVL